MVEIKTFFQHHILFISQVTFGRIYEKPARITAGWKIRFVRNAWVKIDLCRSDLSQESTITYSLHPLPFTQVINPPPQPINLYLPIPIHCLPPVAHHPPPTSSLRQGVVPCNGHEIHPNSLVLPAFSCSLANGSLSVVLFLFVRHILSIHVSECLFVSLYIRLSVCLYVCLFVNVLLPVYVWLHMSMYLLSGLWIYLVYAFIYF